MTTSLPRPKNAAPWTSRSGKTKTQIALASLLPVLITIFLVAGLNIDATLAVVFGLIPVQIIAVGLVAVSLYGRAGIKDAVLIVVAIFLTTLVMVLLLSVIWSVFEIGGRVISWSFLSQNNRYIGPTTDLAYGGVGHAILGSLIAVGITTVIAVPLGLGIAVFLTESRSKLRGFIRVLIQAMSGLPSVVAGLFVFSAFFSTGLMKQSLLAGAIALIPLMLPTVARVAEEALRLVSRDLRNGALALGASAWKAFFQVTLPAARTGVITALLLGLARVIGETAPLLLTVGISNVTSVDPLAPASTLPTYIYSFLAMGTDASKARAWGGALTILVIVGVIFTIARVAVRPVGTTRKAKRK